MRTSYKRSQWIVIELVMTGIASLLFGCLIISVVLAATWTAHVWIIIFALLSGLGVPVAASISIVRRTPVFLTIADRITLSRGILAGGCATLAVLLGTGLLSLQSWLLVLVAAPAALLDVVDGWVARRTGTANAYGARLDMETDAAFLMILSIQAAYIVGPWVLFIGGMRYLFFAAAWWRPALRGRLSFNRFRHFVAGFQSAGLVGALIPVMPISVACLFAATALGLLCVSFGKDIYTLERSFHLKKFNCKPPQRQTGRLRQKLWPWLGHVLAVVVATEFFKEASRKLLGSSASLAPFIEFGWPVWFANTVASTEVVGSVLLIVPKTRMVGALLLAGVMLGAAVTNLANGHSDYVWLNVLLIVATLLLAFQRSRLLRRGVARRNVSTSTRPCGAS